MPDTAAPAAETAYDKVMADVYRPVFFAKLAEYEVVPRTAREAEQLLYLGAGLYAQHREKAAADAAARGTFLDFAVGRFDGSGAAPAAYDDARVKAASARALGADPALYEAAAVLADALAA